MASSQLFSIRSEGDGAFNLSHGGRPLFTYVWQPDIPRRYSPRPYFHPLWTLSGEVTTDSGPEDHPWHQGLSMTCANLAGCNIWGGPSYVQNHGYIQLPNNGRVEHRAWEAMNWTNDEFSAREILEWLDPDGRPLLREIRTTTVRSELIDSGSWVLEFVSHMTNVASRSLDFGSPTTAGRRSAGYGGLFWRGASRFKGAEILAPLVDGDEAMGASAPWLAIRTKQPGDRTPVTMLFVDHPDNPRYPNKWFVRTREYPGVSFSFLFDETYTLPMDGEIRLRYMIFMVDAALTTSQLQGRLDGLTKAGYLASGKRSIDPSRGHHYGTES